MKRYFQSTRIIKDGYFKGLSKKQINEELKPYSTSIVNIDLNFLIANGKRVDIKSDDIPINIFIYKEKKYINPKPPNFKPEDAFPRPPFEDFVKTPIQDKDIVFIDNQNESDFKYFWLIVLFIIDLLLIWFYLFLYKKLSPLQKLKNEIVKFSNGDLNINTKIKGKDEIAQVSNEFNNAIERIKELDDSRKLFLRNILHELKTPITKGKLVSDTINEPKKKNILQKAFLRLEYLLEEFVKLEQLVSGKIELDKKEYRIIDLLDQALDILLIDKEKVDIYPNVTKITVDYEIFSIALKNLIDNAMKYTTEGKPSIVIKEDSLIIKNKGKPLKKVFEEYLKPFNREYESIDKGLGLGLYITNSIIEIHNFKLYYFFNSNYHIIKIDFTKREE